MLLFKIIPAAMVVFITLAGSGTASAGESAKETDEQHELSAVTNAKTSLSQAIAAAEQETGGKAISTGLENQRGPLAYEIEIAKGNTLQKVLVDLDTGKVIETTAADADHEDSGEDDAGEHEGNSKHESD